MSKLKLIYHTFDYWSKNGYLIIKGSKSTKRNKNNIPLFSSNQIKKKEVLKKLSIFENDDPRDSDYHENEDYYDCFPGDPMDYGNN